MRIVYIVTDLGVGGTQKWVELASTELVARGHKIFVIVDEQPHLLVGRLRDAGVEVITPATPPDDRTLQNLFHEYSPDVVHTHVWKRGDFYAKLTVPHGTLKAVTHHWAPNHDLPAGVLRFGIFKNGFRRWRSLRFLKDGYNLHVGCCEKSAQYYRKLIGGQPDVTITGTPNAVRIPTEPIDSRVMNGPPKFLQVGSLIPRKRPDATLTAFASIKRHFPDSTLTFVGKGELLTSLQQFTAKNHLSDITFLNSSDDVSSSYDKANILVCPSTVEGLPYVVLEAAARGLAVVASTAGGVPEVIRHQETGLLFKPGDPQALISNMSALAGDVSIRRRLGVQARIAVQERFSLERHVDELLYLYFNCCGLLRGTHTKICPRMGPPPCPTREALVKHPNFP